MAQLKRGFVNDEKGEGLERIFINELNDCKNPKVLLRGWVHKITDL
ncbi:hypothetical protein [Terrisporobacter mayombei]|uniref:Uncharacterized protein n=1 Tax=Terrisporobacter mayombei TaxID=1541 RepID=A0ABY9Q100_9FIRM|nr:hypothetical protein [Terrisporobacter mayombei]WMT81271.1 hypothetical protein TEMA_16090 [Terrisporobacter mayombei]